MSWQRCDNLGDDSTQNTSTYTIKIPGDSGGESILRVYDNKTLERAIFIKSCHNHCSVNNNSIGLYFPQLSEINRVERIQYSRQLIKPFMRLGFNVLMFEQVGGIELEAIEKNWLRDSFIYLNINEQPCFLIRCIDECGNYSSEIFNRLSYSLSRLLDISGINSNSYRFIPSILGEGGLTVISDNLIIANDIINKYSDDLGIREVMDSQYEVFTIPSFSKKYNLTDPINLSRIRALGKSNLPKAAELFNAVARRSTLLTSENPFYFNDHPDTELALLKDSFGRNFIIANSSYIRFYKSALDELLAYINDHNSRINYNMKISGYKLPILDELYAIPLEEEVFLPANMIIGPNGKILVTSLAVKTVDILRDIVGYDAVVTAKIPSVCNSMGTIGIGGNLRCSTFEFSV